MSRIDTLHAWLGGESIQREITTYVRAAGREIVFLREDELEARLGEARVLLCGIAPRVDWSRATHLELLQALGSGTDSLWPLAGLPDRVHVANARGVHLPEMRDHVLAMIFAFARDLPAFARAQASRDFAPRETGSVHGKFVAIIGMGTVGRAIGEACTSLGMHVGGARASEPYDLHALLARADYVVVTAPLTPKTRGMIDARAIAAMKPSAVVIHVSRGGVVDEGALIDALRAGKIRGAALDVFEVEPLPKTSPLWDLPNVIITPHIAGLTERYVERLMTLALENVALVETGKPPRTAMDRSRGY
jgi:phosphoglycerate dehydrogenase-like enzyme